MPRNLTVEQILAEVDPQVSWFPEWRQFAQDYGYDIRYYYNEGMGDMQEVSVDLVTKYDTDTRTNEPEVLSVYHEKKEVHAWYL